MNETGVASNIVKKKFMYLIPRNSLLKNLQGFKMFQISGNYNLLIKCFFFLFFAKECDYLISPKYA